jgi:hypothetical protein
MPAYEVSAADTRSARRWLESLPATISVEPFGHALHLFTKDDPSAIRSSLEARGFGPVAVHEIVPSLEDVFIALVRTQAGRA